MKACPWHGGCHFFRMKAALHSCHERPARSTSWVERCARYLLARAPELTEEESMLTAEDLWEVSHLAMTPEQAADFASSHLPTRLATTRTSSATSNGLAK